MTSKIVFLAQTYPLVGESWQSTVAQGKTWCKHFTSQIFFLNCFFYNNICNHLLTIFSIKKLHAPLICTRLLLFFLTNYIQTEHLRLKNTIQARESNGKCEWQNKPNQILLLVLWTRFARRRPLQPVCRNTRSSWPRTKQLAHFKRIQLFNPVSALSLSSCKLRSQSCAVYVISCNLKDRLPQIFDKKTVITTHSDCLCDSACVQSFERIGQRWLMNHEMKKTRLVENGATGSVCKAYRPQYQFLWWTRSLKK